ncbi:CheY-like chemotaxis protein [Epilithonimonas hungarica]|uniref:response regulator n=1 Tax=Epilithonimonas hungarica TaxID=454006 RepID=UPI002783504A|nr:response regulator [Epilithonimonas hungarica]MDP9955818.1 CheY-like chemotaxis protein [Epilithonimonas hungarica]
MNKKILIVDDDPRNIFALKLTLKARGFDIETALSAQEAIDKLENDNIGLVLMDMMMPDIDGYQAIGMIRKIDKLDHIPIIAVTAQAMEEDHQKCIDAGAAYYIKKPIDVDQLLNVIEKVS